MASFVTDFLWILSLFPPFWGSVVSYIILQKPSLLFWSISNQACYAFRHVLSCFHKENDLTKLISLVSGRNTISCTNSRTCWPQRSLTFYCWHGYELIIASHVWKFNDSLNYLSSLFFFKFAILPPHHCWVQHGLYLILGYTACIHVETSYVTWHFKITFI